MPDKVGLYSWPLSPHYDGSHRPLDALYSLYLVIIDILISVQSQGFIQMASGSLTQNDAEFVFVLKCITLRHKCKMHMSVLTVSSLRETARPAYPCFPVIPLRCLTLSQEEWMDELHARLKQMQVWELTTYLGEFEAGGLTESLALPVGSKPQKEDWGDIDEDGGHLYNWVKMLFEDGYETRAVLTRGMEDAILIISKLSPPYIQHEFLLSPKSYFVPILLDFFFFRTWRISSSRTRSSCEHRRREFKSWWLYACQSNGYCWEGNPPLGSRSSWFRCGHHH